MKQESSTCSIYEAHKGNHIHLVKYLDTRGNEQFWKYGASFTELMEKLETCYTRFCWAFSSCPALYHLNQDIENEFTDSIAEI